MPGFSQRGKRGKMTFFRLQIARGIIPALCLANLKNSVNKLDQSLKMTLIG
jgi:hypothetical protein